MSHHRKAAGSAPTLDLVPNHTRPRRDRHYFVDTRPAPPSPPVAPSPPANPWATLEALADDELADDELADS